MDDVKDGEATVSVVIPSYNRRPFLAEAFGSLYAQTTPVSEIILVDDRSTDGTVEYVKASYPDVRVIELTENGGAAAARNAGVLEATGDYIAFLDSDDRFTPTKVETQLRELRRTGAVFSTTGYQTMDCRVLKTKTEPIETLHRRNFMGGTSGLMVRTDHMKACLFDPAMKAVQDWELFLRLSVRGGAVHVPEPLYLYDDGEHDRITKAKKNRFIGHRQLWRRHIKSNPEVSAIDRIRFQIVLRMLMHDAKGHQGKTWLWTRLHQVFG